MILMVVLGDEKLRTVYDREGEEGLSAGTYVNSALYRLKMITQVGCI
jgi:hypothetical protein